METAKERPRVSLRDRAGYRFDRTLARSTGTLMGWLVITCLAVVLPVSTLLVWTDPGSPRSLSGRLTAAWRTSAETLRLGAASGTPLRLVLSAVLGLVALLCVSTLVGVITTGLADRMAELSRGRSTVLEQDHVVVLGWSDQVTTVVSELVAARAPHRPRAIVLLADRDKVEMERLLTARVPPAARALIICRSGPASDPDVLALVSPRTASTVLVLPSAEPTADAEVLRILLALRAVLGEGADGPPVLAAVRDDRYRAPARLAAGPHGTVLETDTVTARLIAQCVGRPGLSLVLGDLLDFAGDEFHLADAAPFHLASFGATLLGHPNSCVVGLLTPGGRTLLNPPTDTVVVPGSRLIVLARDDAGTRVEACRHLVDASVIVSAPSEPDPPTRLLLLGWNRRAPLVVGQLLRTARSGSVLDVITDSAVPGPRQPEAEGVTTSGGVRFRSAALSRPETLLGLDLSPYDGLVVLGPDQGEGPDRPDDWTLVTLLALRLLEERTGHEVSLVTELVEDRNRPLASVNRGSDVIVSGKLTGLLMAQIAQNRYLAPVFDELFSAEGAGVCLRPVGRYVLQGAEATFATLVAAARDRGECAIGYISHEGRTEPTTGGVRLNPPKDERRVWNSEDHLVVLATDPGAASAPAARDDSTTSAAP
ncbi:MULTISPECIES: CASTOR/POLLUX-related putative ion channel [Streptomyces]|uniref:NAD-binding lipoprotein n=1 Tax=Streptomyces glycanivorans TaxID=3033808 RepID=A0ABY9JLJ6_9ACTN|nr:MULTISPECIES: NAD-binding lipoprotein [unclassified Streptomyces]WLQ68572.1 NAD-binding lipoprotein [Streptomyces sp. Alt3]WSQ89258.1 NAD-binding lipoprotein [Streptomyces sp. NBC_01212]WSR04735.1 NAD-binding lipoprotein [Streptomyces sp. NBC_01208]WSR52649.1 NAD-binding lipoprotein [Streptomyces sp. NBC_01201]